MSIRKHLEHWRYMKSTATLGPEETAVRTFINWVSENQDSVEDNMVAKSIASCKHNAAISLWDHLETIKALNIFMGSARIRGLMEATIGMPDAPQPDHQSIKWLYTSPGGQRAARIFMYD